MTQPLFDHLAEIAARVAAARQLVLFLDFDGTLAPIVDQPDTAQMPQETRRVLRNLASREKVSLAIISGRPLSDLRTRVGLRNLIYAGNHGLEISGRGLHFVEPEAAQRINALAEVARHLRTRLGGFPGVEVENKVLSASVHFRRAEPESLEEIWSVVQTAVGAIANLFEVRVGRKVFEIRPRVNWNKGMAVRWIEQASAMEEALSIYVGDDTTDEDAFSALPEGITVNVGRAKKTSARYYIAEQQLVQRFLVWLDQAAEGKPGTLAKGGGS